MGLKRFLNERDALVDQAIDGVLASRAGEGLARLADGPGRRVVLRATPSSDRVAVISGGGSGHEPAHAGFVGPGMLDAAVCGEIFASPPVDAVLAAILAVTGGAGCLLVVKNYTGDRLNFGLAAEQARGLGLAVETVIVADDIALPDQARPRGLAGTLFVHKIAGAMAANGHTLAEIAQAARAAASETLSIGLALSDCNAYAPGHVGRLGPDEIELGLGIHGEPGAETLAMADADALMALAAGRLEQAIAARGWGGDTRLALLLNGLGTVPALEMSLLLDSFRRTKLAGRVALLGGPAPMMTALDMNGFSLSALRLTPERARALGEPVAIPAWPGLAAPTAPRTRPAPTLPALFAAPASARPAAQAMIVRAASLLTAMQPEIDALDARIGDGDTGTSFAQAGRAIAASIDRLPLADEAALLATLGRLLASQAGGSSGVLLSILFSAAGQARRDGDALPASLRKGLERLQAHGGARQGDRTMIDALAPALEALETGGLAAAARAARRGADATRTMRAGAGRAANVPEAALRDVPDPGAEAVARLFEGLL